MSVCIEKLPCPDCGSSDSLQTYLNIDKDLELEWYSSFCHGSCWEMKGDPYTNKEVPKVHIKTEEEIQEELKVVKSCKLFQPKMYRGMPRSAFKGWGLRQLLSEFDGKTPYAIGFPTEVNGNLTGWKCRPIHKKDFYGVGRTKDVDPFGFSRALKLGGKSIWFTEGEFDAIALNYCMIQAHNRPAYPVCSLTHGGGSIEKNFIQVENKLKNYKNIILVLDDDDVGHKAEETAVSMLGSKIKVIRKPKGCKDANDAVKKKLTIAMGKLALNLIK